MSKNNSDVLENNQSPEESESKGAEEEQKEIVKYEKPGIYPDIPNDIYHKINAVSRSDLITIDRSIAHYEHRKSKPYESKAMNFGKLLHDAIMYPHLLGNYAYAPSCKKNTKAGKAEHVKFLEDNKGKTIIEREPGKDHPPKEALKQILENIDKSEFVKKFVNQEYCKFEHSLIWVDKATGLTCKCRPDILMIYDDLAIVFDIKSCIDASPDAFRYSIKKFRYGIQAGYYSEGVKRVLGVKKVIFGFIAIETNAPYAIAVYDLHADSIDKANKVWRRGLDKFKKYKNENKITAYPEKIRTIYLRDWEI